MHRQSPKGHTPRPPRELRHNRCVLRFLAATLAAAALVATLAATALTAAALPAALPTAALASALTTGTR